MQQNRRAVMPDRPEASRPEMPMFSICLPEEIRFGASSLFRSDWIGTEALLSLFDAFSLREPVSTSLENAVRTRGSAMFKESSPIAYDAPADLKKWPSLNGQRLNGGRQPYLVFNGTLAECIRELMAKPVKQISLYDIVTEPQPVFDSPVLSPGDAAEIAMRKDFPKG
jgi:hypothetical protein